MAFYNSNNNYYNLNNCYNLIKHEILPLTEESVLINQTNSTFWISFYFFCTPNNTQLVTMHNVRTLQVKLPAMVVLCYTSTHAQSYTNKSGHFSLTNTSSKNY